MFSFEENKDNIIEYGIAEDDARDDYLTFMDCFSVAMREGWNK